MLSSCRHDDGVGSIDEPQNERSRATRAAILDAAWELLEGSGGPAVTLSATAKAAGVSRQGLYLHFASRGELFRHLFDHVNQSLDLDASVRPVLEAPDSLAALDAFADLVATYHSRTISLIRAVDRCRFDDEDAAALWATATTAWHEGCRSVTARLAAEGRLAEPWTELTAADLMWSFMSAEFVAGMTIDRGWSVEELAERLRIVIRRALVRGGPT